MDELYSAVRGRDRLCNGNISALLYLASVAIIDNCTKSRLHYESRAMILHNRKKEFFIKFDIFKELKKSVY